MTEPVIEASAPSSAPAPSAPTVPRARRRWPWVLAAVAGLVLVVLAGTAGGLRWLATSEGGLRWLLGRIPGVEASGVEGTLLGPRLSLDKLVVRWDGGRASAEVRALRIDGLQWTWRPVAGAWVGIDATRVAAATAVVSNGPPSAEPRAPPPQELALPLRARVGDIALDELRVDALPPLTRLAARGLLVDSAGTARHAVERLSLQVAGVAIAGRAAIGSAAPLPLELDSTLIPATGGDAPPWAAVLRASGPLERLSASGTLRGVPRPQRDAPSLDLKAELLPFAPWPLGMLQASTEGLDLAALADGLPQTRWAGEVDVQSRALDAPLSARIALMNGLPGRVDEGRLPIKTLRLDLQGRADQRDRLQAEGYEIVLGDALRDAGRVRGSAQWAGSTVMVESTLVEVRPQWLDGRAPAMVLSGPLTVQLSGLPTARPTSAAASAASAGSGPAPSAATSTPPAAPSPAAWKATARLQLDGRIDGARQAVQLALDATATDGRYEVQRLRATSGNARADATALVQRGGVGDGAVWRVASTGTLAAFDPVPWWPGPADSAWRTGNHRFNGNWTVDLAVPQNALGQPAPALLQRVSGNGTLAVRDSLLAGVPLAAEARLDQAAAVATLRASVDAGGNTLLLDGRGTPGGDGAADRWRAELKADALPALAPLFRLLPGLAARAPSQGSATVVATAEGRWPAIRTEGSLQASQLQLGSDTALVRGTASWRLQTAGAQTLDAEAELTGLRLGAQRAESLRGSVRGTLAQHRIEVTGTVPLAPPPVADALFALKSGTGTRALLRADGAWTAAPAGGGRWQLRVERVALGAWAGVAPRAAQTVNVTAPAGAASAAAPAAVASAAPAAAATAATAQPGADIDAVWADARDLRAEVSFGAAGAVESLLAAPGRLRVADTLALRWDEIRVDLRPALAQIQLRADVEAFAIAPLLARLQPGIGWGGDLRLAARVQVRAAERFEADIVAERLDGDLTLAADGGVVQRLNLTDLRVAVTARDGVWTVSPTVRGRGVGELEGAVRVRTTPQSRWPQASAPLDGRIEARLPDIGVASAYVPAGWRLSGELRTAVTVSGTFGAPRYVGELTGQRIAVRNLLQGVNVVDGDVRVVLAGDTARIERFTVKGGDGTLSLSGSAALGGSAPLARLAVVAERFRLLGRVDRSVVVSGNAELELRADALRLTGRFGVDEGLFDAASSNAPSLDEDVNVQRDTAARADAATAAQAQQAQQARRNVVVNLDVGLGQRLRVRGRGLDALLRGNLRITTPNGRLSINGTVSAEEGSYAAYGQKLDIERGIVAFSGPVENPRLDVLALRSDIDTRVGVSISGTLQVPRARLYSEPEMGDNDKLSWLLLGRAPDGLGRSDTALLQRAALAVLSGENESRSDALLRNIGLDDLSLRQTEGDTRDTVITLGRRLSQRWYIGYERGLNATTGTIQLIYRVAQRFTLRAQGGLENSLDAIYTWRLGETPVDEAARRSVTITPR